MLCEKLTVLGAPIARATVHVRTLHPEFRGVSRIWRRRLDTVSRRSELGTLSTAPDTRYSPEFWMQRTDMHCGAGYRRPEHGELLAEHLKKPTGIGRKTSLLA